MVVQLIAQAATKKVKKKNRAKKQNKSKKSNKTENNSSSGGGVDETFKACRISFALCQMTVVDELRRSRRRSNMDTHEHATFVEFLEAVCRLADMRADP